MHPEWTIRPKRPTRDHFVRLLEECRAMLAKFGAAALDDEHIPPSPRQVETQIMRVSEALDREARALARDARSEAKR